MNYPRLLFTIFLAVAGVLVFAIWGNIYAYAQQSSTPNTIISPELKAKMCNPSNPDLKVVNTTEARICGISKTIKPPLASAATTPKTISSPLTELPNSTESGSSNTGATTNVSIVLKPLPGGTCPQGYHLVSGSVCIKDLPSVAQTKTRPATTNATILPPPPPPSSSNTSQPSGTSSSSATTDNSGNQDNFKTKILKSFNKKFK